MGYFSNGSEGECYEARYCARCYFGGSETGCPIMFLHFHRNYDDCNNPESPLHAMIPRLDNGDNGECVCFTPKDGE